MEKKSKCQISTSAVGEDSSSDRLSNLPDPIIKHILSFTETVYAIQTSVLSRRWRYAWKHLPTLSFEALSIDPSPKFGTFVDDVLLSLRGQSGVVKEIIFSGYEDGFDRDLYRRVVDYAVSHRVQALEFDLRKCAVEFYELFGSITCPDLKTLRLGDLMAFDPGFARFPTLTTLELTFCLLEFKKVKKDEEFEEFEEEDEKKDELDCALNFPCLANLSMSGCSSGSGNKAITIYAPQLHTLKLDHDYQKLNIEIIAQNLKFFRLKVEDRYRVANFSIPYVDRAEILVEEYGRRSKGESLESDLELVFKGLPNAKSLLLRCTTSQTLKKMCKFLEQKRFRLPMLESLVCVSDKPYEVVNYQVQGPSFKRFRRQ